MTTVAAEALTVWAPTGVEAGDLDQALLALFERARDALAQARPVVVLVCEENVLGHGDPLDAAAAHAAIGLVRALATEGAEQRWLINALSVPADDYDVNWIRWTGRLCDPEGPTGILVRLGSAHLGRLPA